MFKKNIGIIGAGRIANKYLDLIYSEKIFNLYGITSRTLRKADLLKKKYKIQNIYKNYKLMLSDEKIDAFILLVSAENINKILLDLIKNKKPFLTEKPITLNNNKPHIILNELNKYNTKNMVAMNRRYYSVFLRGLEILHQKGKILGISIEGHERFYNINIKDYNAKVYNNWIYANSCHTIDLLRFFSGEIKEIVSYSSNYKKKKSNFSANISFKNGIIGNYTSFWNSPGGWSVVIYGENITLFFKPLEKGFYMLKDMKIRNIKESKKDLRYKKGLYLMLIDFKNLILNKPLSKSFENIQSHLKTIDLISKINNE